MDHTSKASLFELRNHSLKLISAMSSQRRKANTPRRETLVWLSCLLWTLSLQPLPAAFSSSEQGELLSKEGQVDFTRQRTNWTPAMVGQKLQSLDRLRTMALSRAMVRLVELGRVRLDQLTTLEILPPRNEKSKGTLDLKTGAIYFFTRDRP